MAQTKLKPMILLLGAFVAKNQEIYKDDSAMLANFSGLTLDDLKFGPITKADGVHTATISSPTRGFEGPGQQWRPASIHSDKVFTLKAEEPLDNKAAVEALSEAGVYSYLDEAGELKHIVVLAPGVEEAEIPVRAGMELMDALNYDIPAEQLVVNDEASTITVNGDTLVGVVEYVVGKPPMITLPEGSIMDLGTA